MLDRLLFALVPDLAWMMVAQLHGLPLVLGPARGWNDARRP